MPQLLGVALSFLLARLREPSTHAGLAAVLYGAARMWPQWAPILEPLAVALGGVAVCKPDTDRGPRY